MYAATILVVDDDEGFVDLLHYGLKRAGFTVLQAYAGRSALDVIQTERPDLVVLDVRLPDMSGFAVLSALRPVPTCP